MRCNMGYSLCLNDVGLALVTVTANEINQEARWFLSTSEEWMVLFGSPVKQNVSIKTCSADLKEYYGLSWMISSS